MAWNYVLKASNYIEPCVSDLKPRGFWRILTCEKDPNSAFCKRFIVFYPSVLEIIVGHVKIYNWIKLVVVHRWLLLVNRKCIAFINSNKIIALSIILFSILFSTAVTICLNPLEFSALQAGNCHALYLPSFCWQ